jgi:hypothetical protein
MLSFFPSFPPLRQLDPITFIQNINKTQASSRVKCPLLVAKLLLRARRGIWSTYVAATGLAEQWRMCCVVVCGITLCTRRLCVRIFACFFSWWRCNEHQAVFRPFVFSYARMLGLVGRRRRSFGAGSRLTSSCSRMNVVNKTE